MGFPLHTDTTAFLVTGQLTEDEVASEEVIGIFSIAWRCLYAAITKSRMENLELDLETAVNRAYWLLHDL